MRKYLFLFCYFTYIAKAFSQQCAADYLLVPLDSIIEESYLRNFLTSNNRSDREYILPVVVHVIHQNGDENISAAQIQQGIVWLNSAFANEAPYFDESGVDSKIQFCLARRTERGLPTDGILRINSPLTNYNFSGFDKDLKRLSRWDPSKYINIWLVNSISMYGNSNIAGYAYPPTVAGSDLDGLVMEVNFFGKDNSLTVPLIHEMGHYLGLLHTFNGGCKNDNCLIDGDKVCDTPPDGINIAKSCNGPFNYNSCSTDEDDQSTNNPFRPIVNGGIGDQADLEDNFMDYGFYSCAVNFTSGQIQRMQFFLEEKRNDLTMSNGCNDPCTQLTTANFAIDKAVYNAGEIIVITNNSSFATEYRWELNGNILSNEMVPLVAATGNGLYSLKLIAWNSDPNCDTSSFSVSLNVICPTQAKFDYQVLDSLLIIENSSLFSDSILTIVEFGNTIVFTSSNNRDSFELSNGIYVISLIAFGSGCNDTLKFNIEIANDGNENCYNGVDDDLDGFVDNYDPDCPCDGLSFNRGCVTTCEYYQDNLPVKLKQKWVTNILHDLELNISQFLVYDSIIINPFSLGSLDTSYHGYDFIDARKGDVIRRVFTDTLINNFYWGRYFSIIKMNTNNEISILAPTQNNRIILCNHLGEIQWSTKRILNFYERPNYLKIADFNGDRNLEFYYGNKVYNLATGKLLFNGNDNMGCISYPFKLIVPKKFEYCGWGAFSVAADITPHAGLELAAGNVVYEIDLNNFDDTLNNTHKTLFAPPEVLDGSTAVADIDLDGKLDVIVNKGATNADSGGLWVWDPRTLEVIAGIIFPKFSSSDLPGYMNGGIPIVGNIDNDCYPEIGVSYVNEFRMYKYDGSKNLGLLYSIPISDFSGVISSTMFDLNRDGEIELIIRDEKFLRVIEARSGLKIDSFEIHSGTLTEQPIITDVNSDGHAEILVSGYLPDEKNSLRIFCFESANIPWAPARSVWNQAGYHITNVNDDLTIPRQQQNNAAFFDTDSCAQTTCNQPYNTFMCQATYRTQDGCVKWPAVDLSVDALDYRCTPDSLYITLEVRNQSDNAMKHDSLRLGIYEQNQNAPLQTIGIRLTRDAQGKIVNSDTINIAVANDKADRWQLRFLVNILDSNTDFTQNIKGLTAVLECDYLNNTDSIVLDLAIKTLDLGPDLTKCRTAVVTLEAPADFVSYVWSDGSIDSSYTSSIPGTHYLTATDVCNRVYRDSVTFTINPILSPQLGGDTLVCEDDLVTFGLPSEFDWVRWLPSEVVSCDTCHTTTLNADTTTQLIVLGSKAGCIDMDTVEISIQPLKKFREMLTICKGDSVLFNQSYVSQEGSYEYRIGNCDSLITLELRVLAPDSIKLPRKTICEGDSAYFLGKWWKEELNSTVKLKNQYACDSFITYELRVIDTIHTTRTSQICEGDSLFVNGDWLKTEGSYPYIFTTLQGCDSIEEVRLTVMPSYHQSETASICAGDSIQQWGTWYASEGTYSQTFTSAGGCDSTESLVLTVEPLVMAQRSYEICEGSKLTLSGVEYTMAGNYTLHLPAATGCDTLLNFELRISALVHKTENYKLCDGDSVFINNEWVTGNDTVVYITFENGCPTEVTARVLSLAPQTSSFFSILCPEDSILINGQWVRGNTNFSYALTGTAGCDSVVTASITSLAWPPAPVINLDCESAAYEAIISLESPWHVSWSNGDTSTSTAITTMPASATVQYDNRCLRTYDLLVGSLPDLQSLPGFDDQNITAGEGLPLTVNLDLGMWKIKWSPAAVVSCDTCFSITVIADRNATITLEMTHISGCTYTRSFGIVVESLPVTIAIPNVFTPGTPGSNSEWHISLLEGYTVLDVAIYDRWGSKVYQTVNATPAWDGTFNGKDLLPGVYIYTLKYQDPYGIAHFLKGDLTIIR